MQTIRKCVAAALLAGALTSCHSPATTGAPQARPRLAGRVTALEPIALPPTAIVHVELSDVSRLDAPAVVLSERDLTGVGSLPTLFELPYEPHAIDPSHTYAVRARINARGRLLFTTETAVRVLTRGCPTEIEIVVRRLP